VQLVNPKDYTTIYNNGNMITPKEARFESIAKLTMPELFDTENVVETEILEEWEKFEYHLSTPLPILKILDVLEQQNDILQLYYFIPTNAILSGRCCCAVSNPNMEYMIKIATTTDDKGLCDTIHLTIYSSLDFMLGDITNERKRMIERFNFGFEESYCNFLSLMS